MNLSDAKKGGIYTIKQINLPDTVKRRLQILGMTDGTLCAVLNKKHSGPMIVKVRGTRFALGKGFCRGISVEEASV